MVPVFEQSIGSMSEANDSNRSTLSTIGELIADFSNIKTKKVSRNYTSNKTAWNKKETLELIKLVNVYGSDFSMIAEHMSKTRDQIKRRFKYLEKKQMMSDIFESKIVDLTE